MITVPLSAKGPAVSVLGFGASPLGNVFGDVSWLEAESAVHDALDGGINFFDTSPYYGRGLSEERLGRALLGRRDRAVVATKCGRYGADNFDFSAGMVRRSVEGSLLRLRTDCVDLLQAHDCEFTSVTQILEETLPAMERCRAEGKTRLIGITGYQLGNLLRLAVGARERGLQIDCILSYCRYDLANTSMETRLAGYAAEHGIGLINGSPLHMGLLTTEGAPAWHPASERARLACAEAARLCAAESVALEEVALQFCLDREGFGLTLTGMGTAELVKKNLDAMAASRHPELTLRVRALLRLGGAGELWPSGLPENWDTEARERAGAIAAEQDIVRESGLEEVYP